MGSVVVAAGVLFCEFLGEIGDYSGVIFFWRLCGCVIFSGVSFCCGWVIERVSALSVVAGSSVVGLLPESVLLSLPRPSVLWECRTKTTIYL